MKKIYYMLLLAALSMTMVSCDDNWDSPYYVDDIVGSWVSYYGHDMKGEYDIIGRDQVRYDFYSNYTGRYTYYTYYGGMDFVDFDWQIRGDRLIIYYYDGDSEYLYYGYDRNGDLIMATDPHFYQYTAYCPAGFYYYSQAKDVVTDSTTATTKAKESTSTAPKGPRATKAREALVEK